ncbi:MAG: 2-C-methyl-D-erythritol 4-phosphate cytidylyltransferase [Dokdonella sp.]
MISSEARLWCVIPAAGKGARFGGDVPKQYCELAGKPLLRWTLERLASHPNIAGLMVVLASEDARWFGVSELSGKPVLTAVGGGERADSVVAGVRALPAAVAAEDFILVHDAARLCVRADDISRLIEAGMRGDGALLATPLRDTLKRADPQQRVVATEARESRWRAQTPQMFRRGALESALQSARSAGIEITDEAMAMELIGAHPLLVEGSEDNIKITTAADAAIAELLLSRDRSC